MNIEIKRMEIDHFKGITHMDITMDGDMVISGRNASGKTSIFDAFTWCLFGKDSSDSSDFWVKPHSQDGSEIHNLETRVMVVLDIDGSEKTFCHSMTEKWVKKNGEVDRVYSGNTHSYEINSVNVTASEYAKTIGEFVKQDVFRLITNPMAFNALDWKKRREILLKLSPIDIDGVLLAKPEYSPIRQEMELRKTDLAGIKKVKSTQRKANNEELDQIPAKVTELQSMIDLQTSDDKCKQMQEDEIQKEIVRIKGILKKPSCNEEKKQQLQKLLDASMKAKQKYTSKLSELESNRERLENSLHADLDGAERNIKSIELQIEERRTHLLSDETANKERLEKLIAETRQEWYTVNSETMPEYKGSDKCPTCGQILPFDQIEKAKETYRENWIRDKKNRLAVITENGQALKKRIELSAEKIKGYEDQIKEFEQKKKDLEDVRSDITRELKKISTTDCSQNSEILELEKAADDAELEFATYSSKTSTEEEDNRYEELVEELRELQSRMTRIEQVKALEQRIKELTDRQRELAVQTADIEKFLILLDQFSSERCSMLEKGINDKFRTVRWSLFERQINGGIAETCVCLINGIQFSDANNAAKINSGLEIIETLSDAYGIHVPVFIDNAESVNCLTKIPSQRIMMVVDFGDLTIRKEHGNV